MVPIQSIGRIGQVFYVALLTCAMMFFWPTTANAERFAGAHFLQLIGEVLMLAFILFYLFMR